MSTAPIPQLNPFLPPDDVIALRLAQLAPTLSVPADARAMGQ